MSKGEWEATRLGRSVSPKVSPHASLLAKFRENEWEGRSLFLAAWRMRTVG